MRIPSAENKYHFQENQNLFFVGHSLKCKGKYFIKRILSQRWGSNPWLQCLCLPHRHHDSRCINRKSSPTWASISHPKGFNCDFESRCILNWKVVSSSFSKKASPAKGEPSFCTERKIIQNNSASKYLKKLIWLGFEHFQLFCRFDEWGKFADSFFEG